MQNKTSNLCKNLWKSSRLCKNLKNWRWKNSTHFRWNLQNLQWRTIYAITMITNHPHLIVRNKVRKRIRLNVNNKLKLIVGTIYHLSKAFNIGQQITRQIEKSGNRCWESQCRIDGCKWLQNIYYESKRNRVHCTKFVYHVKRIH